MKFLCLAKKKKNLGPHGVWAFDPCSAKHWFRTHSLGQHSQRRRGLHAGSSRRHLKHIPCSWHHRLNSSPKAAINKSFTGSAQDPYEASRTASTRHKKKKRKKNGKAHKFQQGNFHLHGVRCSVLSLQQNKSPWCCPDINPTECFGDALKRKAKQVVQCPATATQFHKAIQQACDYIHRATVNHRVHPINRRSRCTAVVHANGGHTRYWL